MRLILEDQVARARTQIVDVKNNYAIQIVKKIKQLGFREPKLDKANETSDDAIVYFEAGQNRAMPKSQIVMVRVITDVDIQVQLPAALSQDLGLRDFRKVNSLEEVWKTLEDIATSLRMKLSHAGYGGDVSVGHIRERAQN